LPEFHTWIFQGPQVAFHYHSRIVALVMADTAETIMYTYTDEAPMLATHAFYPIVAAFCKQANVKLQKKDISVAGRVLAQFDLFKDELAELGKLAREGGANIIKLPNISASIPQLKECIAELQGKGFQIPNYPEGEPTNEAEKEAKEKYGKVLGSAVNPVLREGNSDRRAAVPVKEYAKVYPHGMGAFSPECKTCVMSMDGHDFYGNEKSCVVDNDCTAKIVLVGNDGTTTTLKEKLPLQAKEVLDASFMSHKALCAFYGKAIKEAQDQDILFSLHLKATMMKVSDPILFGHCVKVYYKEVFEKYKTEFAELKVNANNGLGDVYKKIADHPKKTEIEAAIMACYNGRKMAMVDGGRGITNLHVPSDIIIDNSMPTAIKAGGKMWNVDDKEEEFLAAIPDRSYAGVFKTCVDFCKANGQFDPKTMGCCPNVGLMAQKAEEYGSHPCTFEIAQDGKVKIMAGDQELLSHTVEKGDIYRSCQTKMAPIQDWIKLAAKRCKANDFPDNSEPCMAIFWLDDNREHDKQIKKIVEAYKEDHPEEFKDLDIEIMSPNQACLKTCERAKIGKHTITVTGNVLRDYLTDLFPILELGTSAKMLSIVPMLNGGSMYETGAGGSAPKHVQQFTKEGHLRWDSLGEYLALSCAFVDLGEKNKKAKTMANCLNSAVGTFLKANKNPSRTVKEIDNRGSHYWLARYWSEELSKQTADAELQKKFMHISAELENKGEQILQELLDCQGSAVNIGGYYKLDKEMADAAMRPSQTFNNIVAQIETMDVN